MAANNAEEEGRIEEKIEQQEQRQNGCEQRIGRGKDRRKDRTTGAKGCYPIEWVFII